MTFEPVIAAVTDQETPPINLGIGHQFQRGTFTAAGRDWLFFASGPNDDFFDPPVLKFTSSGDGGETWETPSVVRPLDEWLDGGMPSICVFDLHFDGTYLHYALSGSTFNPENKLYYRRGLPKSDGTIDWDDEVEAEEFEGSILELSISTDSNGVPFISFEHYGTSAGNAVPYVTKATSADGTWTTASGHPFQLSELVSHWWTGVMPTDNSGGMAVVYWHDDGDDGELDDQAIWARFWDGDDWSEPVGIDDPRHRGMGDIGLSTTVAYVGDPAAGVIHVAWVDTSDSPDTVRVWTGNANGGAVDESHSLDLTNDFSFQIASIAASVDANTGELVIVYMGDGLAAICMVRRSGTTWGTEELVVYNEFSLAGPALQISDRSDRLLLAYQENWLFDFAPDSLYVIGLTVPTGGGTTHEEQSWASSYAVKARETAAWASSYAVKSHEAVSWSSRYNVGSLDHETVSWASGYLVNAHESVSWSSQYVTRQRDESAWASGYAVKSREQASWTSGYTVEGEAAWEDIEGATGDQYTPVEDDIGYEIRCVVTATNSAGSASEASNEVGPVEAAPETVQADWSSRYVVKAREQAAWQSAYTVKAREASAWASRYVVVAQGEATSVVAGAGAASTSGHRVSFGASVAAGAGAAATTGEARIAGEATSTAAGAGAAATSGYRVSADSSSAAGAASASTLGVAANPRDSRAAGGAAATTSGHRVSPGSTFAEGAGDGAATGARVSVSVSVAAGAAAAITVGGAFDESASAVDGGGDGATTGYRVSPAQVSVAGAGDGAGAGVRVSVGASVSVGAAGASTEGVKRERAGDSVAVSAAAAATTGYRVAFAESVAAGAGAGVTVEFMEPDLEITHPTRLAIGNPAPLVFDIGTAG